MSDRLQKIISQVDTVVSDDFINELLASKQGNKRLLALLTIQQKVEQDFIPASIYFDTVKEFLSDADNDCKWQAFITVGYFMETKPEDCWKIIMRLGDSEDEDTRAAVATILLEHYFENNPHLFNEKFREYKRHIKAGQKNLLKTLALCRSEWGSEANNIVVGRFLENQNCGV